MGIEETAGTKSQEYYWEQEKELFAIRRFFYKHNLLPKNDSYFPDDIIKAFESLRAENKRLKTTIQNALVSLEIITMPTMGNDVATDEELLKTMGDSFREALKGVQNETV